MATIAAHANRANFAICAILEMTMIFIIIFFIAKGSSYKTQGKSE
jgi:hypothetical protein